MSTTNLFSDHVHHAYAQRFAASVQALADNTCITIVHFYLNQQGRYVMVTTCMPGYLLLISKYYASDFFLSTIRVYPILHIHDASAALV